MVERLLVKKGNGVRRTKGEILFDCLNVAVMVLVLLITIYPFYYVFLSSISGVRIAAGLRLLPNQPTLSAYKLLFEYTLLWNAYLNTIVRCVLGVTISLLVTALAAYPLSKRWLPFSGALTNYFLITMLFGGGLVPTYLLIKDLNMLNTVWALVLPGAVSAYNTFIVRNFFRSIPEALEESAMLDGANWFTIWSFIIVPLSKPVLATVALWVLEPLHGIPSVAVGVAGVAAFLGLRVCTLKEFRSSLNWENLVFIGTAMGLATVFSYTGIDTWVVGLVGPALEHLAFSPFLFVAGIALVTVALRFVIASEMAFINIFMAFMAPMAISLGINPWVVGIAVYAMVNPWFMMYQNPIYMAAFYSVDGRMVNHAPMAAYCAVYLAICLAGLLVSVPYWMATGVYAL